MCKCTRAGSSSGPTQHISRGFCPWKVLRSFLTAFLPVTLFDSSSYFWNTKGRQTVLFPSCQWNSWEPENGTCFFPARTASAAFPELWFGPAYFHTVSPWVSFFPHQASTPHIKPQLPTENWWKRVPHIPSSSDAVCSCRSDAGGPQFFPELRSGAKVLDTQADTGVHASSRQLLSLLPRDSYQAGWVMQRYAGHPLRQMGAWGAHGHPWGMPMRQHVLIATYLTNTFYFIRKKVYR